jgi:hypothetical protein
MIYSAVKTRQRAKEIVMDKVDELGGNSYTKTTRYSNTNSDCECGYTQSYTCKIWSETKCLHIITVTYCEVCGDDDAFVGDVLEIS